MTLRFLGEITDADAAAAGDALERVSTPAAPVQAAFRGLGAFPNARRASVLWAGTAGGSAELSALAAQVVDATSGIGQNGADKPFVPHLTLARFRRPVDLEKLDVFTQLTQTDLGCCTIGSILLMQSRLRPEGAQYSVLRECRLGGRS
jgi:2'-5' RNA ligase